MSQLAFEIVTHGPHGPPRGRRGMRKPAQPVAKPLAKAKRPNTGEAGIVNKRILSLLEQLESRGSTTRSTLLDSGWIRWQLDRTVYKARRAALISSPIDSDDGHYRLTVEGRRVLRSPDPAGEIGPSSRGGCVPAADTGAVVSAPSAPHVVVTPVVEPTIPRRVEAAMVAAIPATDPEVRMRRQDAIRKRVEAWLSGLRPETRARLVDGGHAERLVELAWRCAGLA